MNELYYGDNLTFMRDMMKTASVDLIYLDPPFNSNRNYNLLYKYATGVDVPEQEIAFCDAWTLTSEKEDLITNFPNEFKRYTDVDPEFLGFWNLWINALRNTRPKLLAYLVYMTYRLLEMRRILKPTGSIYLHCDYNASHYIKVMMDGIFGHSSFRNEIVWHYKGNSVPKSMFPKKHDTLLFYVKSNHAYFSPVLIPYAESTIKRYNHVDADGRRYKISALKGGKQEKVYMKDGKMADSVWEIPIVRKKTEKLGYPTQKPLSLLERVIKASSQEDDVVFDPFCGCGTTIYSAHLNNRQWIGCDIAILSVHLVRDVLKKRYDLEEGKHYKTHGIPMSVEGARELLDTDSKQFQNWAVELAGGFCSQKKSNDKGVDGRIYFQVGTEYRNMVISVKGGGVQPAQIRELRGVLERENSNMAGFICLSNPTQGMIDEAAKAGLWEYEGKKYDRIQIRTIQQLLNGIGFNTPTQVQTLNWDRQLRLFNENLPGY